MRDTICENWNSACEVQDGCRVRHTKRGRSCGEPYCRKFGDNRLPSEFQLSDPLRGEANAVMNTAFALGSFASLSGYFNGLVIGILAAATNSCSLSTSMP